MADAAYSTAESHILELEKRAPAPAVSKGLQEGAESLPRPATSEEVQNLPHIRTSIPTITWLLVFTGSASAFARWGVTITLRK